MKYMVDPKQIGMFDPELGHFGFRNLARLHNGWQGIFRRSLLAAMPAEELAEDFSPDKGRPTKELYSMAGLVLIAEMNCWTSEEASSAYAFDQSLQYALNVGHVGVELSSRSVERFQRIFREKELAQTVFERVTSILTEELQLVVDMQRLDSTHLFSDMARFGRTRLLATCINRFLVQLKRHYNGEYAALPELLRERCQTPGHKVFGTRSPKGEDRARLRLELAQDMLALIDRFAEHAQIPQMTSYKAMVRVFSEQCEVTGGQIAIRKKTGGRTMQNPSDPDATYDGHKGKGYQVQLAETCHPDNPVQLITCAIPQTAADEDGDALPEVVAQLEDADMKPAELLADTLYGSDANEQLCQAKGIDLVAPVRGKPPQAGFFPQTDAQRRLFHRRFEEQTEIWLDRYRRRAGIEGTNSGLKRRVELGRLRVRGRKSVFNVTLLKITGWNVFRAVEGLSRMAKKVAKAAKGMQERDLFANQSEIGVLHAA